MKNIRKILSFELNLAIGIPVICMVYAQTIIFLRFYHCVLSALQALDFVLL